MAQLPQGIWVSSHELRLGTYLDLKGENEWMLRYMKKIFVDDSVYTGGSLVLVTDTSQGSRLLRDIRSSFVTGVDSTEIGKHIFNRDTFRVASQSDSKLLLIRQFTDSIWYENHFHRLPDSDLNPQSESMAIPKPGSHLQLYVSDTLDRSFQLDFIDDRRMVVSGAQDGMPYTVGGTWHSRWIGNTLFFSFFDNHFEGMQLYYFFADSADALVGGSYNDAELLQSEPPQLHATLAAIEVLDSAGFSLLRNNLVGSWQAINDPLFYDPAIEFGFLSYQSFELEFRPDGTYEMLKSGSILKNGDSIPLEETSTGEWEVSPTGRYIVLRPSGDIPFYLSIENATPEELDVHYFMKTLSEFPNYNVFENRRVEFRK